MVLKKTIFDFIGASTSSGEAAAIVLSAFGILCFNEKQKIATSTRAVALPAAVVVVVVVVVVVGTDIIVAIVVVTVVVVVIVLCKYYSCCCCCCCCISCVLHSDK